MAIKDTHRLRIVMPLLRRNVVVINTLVVLAKKKKPTIEIVGFETLPALFRRHALPTIIAHTQQHRIRQVVDVVVGLMASIENDTRQIATCKIANGGKSAFDGGYAVANGIRGNALVIPCCADRQRCR